MDHFVLILAAGEGSRLKSNIPKQFLELNGIPILMHSILAFKKADPSVKVYIALSKKYELYWDQICNKYDFNIEHQKYIGGSKRSETVFLGLKKIHKEIAGIKNQNTNNLTFSNKKNPIISIHDAARPFIDTTFILELLQAAKTYGSAVPVINLKSALRKKNVKDSVRSLGKNREQYMLTQTPQFFYFEDIYKSYQQLNEQGVIADAQLNPKVFDDASVYDFSHETTQVHTTNGREYNIKITTELDYSISEHIYKFFKNLQ